MNKILSSRERVLTALDHKEPDRVPLDLGGYQSGITTIAYEKLKNPNGESIDPLRSQNAINNWR